MDDKIPEGYAAIGCVSRAFLKFPLPVATQVMHMMSNGKGCRPIAEYLHTQGIKLGSRQVGNLMAEERAARAPISKELAKERLAPELDQKIDLVESVLDDLVETFQLYKLKQKNHADHKMQMQVADRIAKFVELYQKFAGISDDGRSDGDGAMALNQKLANLANRLADVKIETKDEDEFDIEDDRSTEN